MRQFGIRIARLFAMFGFFLILAPSAHAATNGRMIDDSVFDNSGTMSAAEIQTFLNGFPNSCLKNYTDDMPSADPTRAYFDYSGTGSAAQIIRRVADNYGINPRVLLTKLEQESSLVSGGSGCQLWRQASAIGFKCYDGANPRTTTFRGSQIQTCVATDGDMGVARQLSKGGWLLKWGKERANGNLNWMVPDDATSTYGGPMTQGSKKRCSGCATVYYDGYWSGVYLESGATASLYNYTPYLNQAFDDIWEGWWGAGSTVGTPYAWAYVEQTSDAGSSIRATQKATWTVQVKNTGNTIWQNFGDHPVRLGTSNGIDRSSSFCDATWSSCNRPAILNETSVAPGQIGSFTFTVQAPAQVGSYKEYFNLVAEGITWMNDLGLYWSMNISASNLTGTVTANTLPGTMTASSTVGGTITIRNDGNVVWYKLGKFPTHIGTYSPSDRQSKFEVLNWVGATRPAAMNEASVAPGQSATFTFSLTAPIYNGAYTESFSLVTDGYSWFNQAISHSVVVNGGQPPLPSSLSADQSLTANQRLVSDDGRYQLIMQSDGNLVLYSPYRALWWTGTNGRGATRAVMQHDGNLVLYDAQSRAVWYTRTDGNSNAGLALQSDGNLVVYNPQGRPLWYTRTNGTL